MLGHEHAALVKERVPGCVCRGEEERVATARVETRPRRRLIQRNDRISFFRRCVCSGNDSAKHCLVSFWLNPPVVDWCCEPPGGPDSHQLSVSQTAFQDLLVFSGILLTCVGVWLTRISETVVDDIV